MTSMSNTTLKNGSALATTDDRIAAAAHLADVRARLALRAGELVSWEFETETGSILTDVGLAALFGVDPSRLTGLMDDFVAAIHPDDRERVLRDFDQARVLGGAYRSEFRVIHPDGAVRWLLGVGEGILADDGRLHVVGYNADITERKQAEQARHEAQADLRHREKQVEALLRAGRSGTWEADLATGDCVWDAQLAALHGFAPQPRVMDVPTTAAMIHPDDRDRVSAAFQAALSSGVLEVLDFRVSCPDGVERWFTSSAVLVRGEAGAPDRLVGVARDITEQRRSELALRAYEQRWQLALTGANDGLWDWDIDTGEVWFSDRWQTMLGYEPGEVEGHVRSWERLVHPDDKPEVMRVLQDHLEGRTPTYETEHRVRHKDGSWVWVLDRGTVVERDRQGRSLRAVGTHTDVTPRKQAEERLRESEERFRALVDAAAEVVWTADSQGAAYEDSPSWRAFTGQSVQEWIGWGWHDAVHPDDRARCAQHWRQCLANLLPYEIEYRLRHHAGGYRWTTARAMPLLHPDGTLKGWVGMNTDISARKDAEERLRESEERMRRVLTGARAGYWQFTLDPPASFWDQGWRDLYGFGPDEEPSDDKWRTRVHPDDLPRIEANIQDALSGTITGWQQDFRVLHPVRGERWVHDRVEVQRDASGRPLSVNGLNFDVTERKRIEEALRGSEALVRDRFAELDQIYRFAPVGLFTFDRDHRFQRINERMAEINGFSVEDHAGRSMDEIVPDLADHLREVYRPVLERGEPVLDVELHGETPKMPGVKRDWLASYFPLRSGSGESVGLIGAVLEVTERKQAEERLRESEAFARSVVESSADCIKVLDLEGRLTFMNGPGLCMMEIDDFAPLCGEKWVGFWPDETQPEVERAVAAARAGGAGRFVAFCPTAKGTPKWWDVSVTPVLSEIGQPVRLIATSRDITDLKRAEEQQALLSRELVHRVKNTLATVQAVVSSTARNAGSIGEFRDVVTKRITSLAKTHTLLTDKNWKGASLRDVLASELEAYDHEGKRVSLQGPDIDLPAEVTLGLSMAVHESTLR